MKDTRNRGRLPLEPKTTDASKHASDAPGIPYFARRQLLPDFKKAMDAGKLKGGTDSTILISEDREDRYS
jgi:hypothetical protein